MTDGWLVIKGIWLLTDKQKFHFAAKGFISGAYKETVSFGHIWLLLQFDRNDWSGIDNFTVLVKRYEISRSGQSTSLYVGFSISTLQVKYY